MTFGGYDSSRLVPNNVTFDLAPDISRDLVVGLQSITSTAANGSNHSLLPNPIWTFIDSTLPLIYLPPESCQAFENAFGLTYNDAANLYTVDDSLHQSLTTSNPNITFQLGNSLTDGPTVDIVLPYASFDLLASPPRVEGNATKYFPLKRAANETQYTLGRTFLQEAYVSSSIIGFTFGESDNPISGILLPTMSTRISPSPRLDSKMALLKKSSPFPRQLLLQHQNHMIQLVAILS